MPASARENLVGASAAVSLRFRARRGVVEAAGEGPRFGRASRCVRSGRRSGASGAAAATRSGPRASAVRERRLWQVAKSAAASARPSCLQRTQVVAPGLLKIRCLDAKLCNTTLNAERPFKVLATRRGFKC